MNGNKKIFILTISMLLLLGWDCKKPPPPEHHNPRYVPSVQLAVVDTGVVDVTLKVTFLDTTVHRTFILKRDSIMLGVTPAVGGLDTTVLDGALQPNHTYHYTLYRTLNGQNADSSKVQVTTMDTTTHNFTWVVDTLGEQTSYLKDVCIINENDVMAVGEIYARDSSGQLKWYNVARWNGQEWKLSIGATVAVNAVFGFNSDDIWIGTSAPYHWDGQTWTPYNITGLFNGYISKIWGTSDNNLFIVGTNGVIAHFDGTSWSKMESGTTIDLLDVWGSPDGLAIWTCGYRSNYSESILLRYNGSIWEQYGHSPPWGIYEDLFSSIWFPENDSAYVLGSGGVFRHAQHNTLGYRKLQLHYGVMAYSIRGTKKTDVSFVGDYGMVWHFNGASWKRYSEIANEYDGLRRVSMFGNVMIAVGERNYDGIRRYGLVYRGYR